MAASWLERYLEDYLRVHDRIPAVRWTALLGVLENPGLLANLVLRVECAAHEAGRNRAARSLRTLNVVLTGVDVVPGAQIGGGLLMHHPNGIVIGWGAVIGRNCAIFQQVTLGERHGVGGTSHAYPRVGDDVVLGAGARVLGGVVVGDGASVAANAVVLADVPPRSVVAGAPATVRTQRRV